MKIEFKLPGQNHFDTFVALTKMLDVINRYETLDAKIVTVMNYDEENLPEHVHFEYIKDGFQVEFNYYKKTGKISLTSRKVS